MPPTDVLDTDAAVDDRVTTLRTAVSLLLDGYAEIARRLPAFGAPPEVAQALLEPLRTAADRAATLLTEAAG